MVRFIQEVLQSILIRKSFLTRLASFWTGTWFCLLYVYLCVWLVLQKKTLNELDVTYDPAIYVSLGETKLYLFDEIFVLLFWYKWQI